eukprot:3479282-Amphidinium_carterae.1
MERRAVVPTEPNGQHGGWCFLLQGVAVRNHHESSTALREAFHGYLLDSMVTRRSRGAAFVEGRGIEGFVELHA